MEVGKLTVQRRYQSGKGNARKLRRQGMIPGVCYGFQLDEPLAVSVGVRALEHCLDPVKRQNTVIDITVEDGGQIDYTITAMLKEYQVEKLKRELLHVDFIAIDKDQSVVAEIPIEFTGKAVGTVTGGQLHIVRRDVEVRCKPADIPPKVVLDITDLDTNGVLHVSDLSFPEGVTAITSERFTVITCSAPEVEAEEEIAEEEVAAAPVAPAS